MRGKGALIWPITNNEGFGGPKDQKIACHFDRTFCPKSTTAAPRAAQTAGPPCGREFDIKPARRPCGKQWAPDGQWPKKYWCYTDYSRTTGEYVGAPNVTFCTDGYGTWQRTGLFDRCMAVEGWCG